MYFKLNDEAMTKMPVLAAENQSNIYENQKKYVSCRENHYKSGHVIICDDSDGLVMGAMCASMKKDAIHPVMAINYCSYIKDWTPWTTSKQAFVTRLKELEWPYYFRPAPTGRYGSSPGAGLGYGSFSPLQPNAGLCLERARQAFAQVPPYYQRLLLHFTSGRSSNPLLAMQHSQAAMYEGTEIFAISIESYGISEELRMSVSGFPYLMRIPSISALSRRHLDKIIQNVCRVERKPVLDSTPELRTGSSTQTNANNADGAENRDSVIGLGGGTNGARDSGAETDGVVTGTENVGGVGSNDGFGETGTGPRGAVTGNGEVGGIGTNNGDLGGGIILGTGGAGSDSGGVGGVGANSGGVGGVGAGTNSGGLRGTGNGNTNSGTGGGNSENGRVGGTGGIGTSSGGIEAPSSGSGTGGRGRRFRNRGPRGRGPGIGGSNGGVDNGGSSGIGTGSGGEGGTGGILGGNGGLGGGTGGVGSGTGGIGSGTGSGGLGGVLGGPGNGGLGGVGGGLGGLGSGGIGGGGLGGGSGNGGSGGIGIGLGGVGGGTGNGGIGGVGTGNNAGGSGGTGGGGANNGNNNNNNNGGNSLFPGGSQSLCVPVGFISNPFLRQLYLAGRRPCPIVTMRPLPSIPEQGCVDLSSVDNSFVRDAILLINYPRPACADATPPAAVATTIASPTTGTNNQQCVDLSGVPQELHDIVLILNAPLEACTNSTNTSIPTPVTTNMTFTEISTTSAQITTAASSPACIDLSMFSPQEKPGALILLSLYQIQPCSLTTNSSAGSGDSSSSDCVDVSRFSEDQKEIIVSIIKPALPCNGTLGPTIVSPVITNSTVFCVNVSSVNSTEKDIAVEFIVSRGLLTCGDFLDTTVPTKESCADISNYTTPESRAKAIEFYNLHNISVCPDNITFAITTESSVTTSPTCLDISIFPVYEQLGAVLFLSLYGIQACPLTNSSSEGDTNDPSACVDVSWLTAEQKAIVTDIIQPALPCNETSGPTIASPTTWNTTVVCAYISNVNNTDRDIAISFIISRGLSLCNSSPPCLDVSIFPIDKQPGAVLFLSLYEIQACPLTNSSSDSDGANSSCVDVSWLTAEQKAVVTDIIQPALPCNETSGPTIASPTTWNTTLYCAYISNANNTDRDIALTFILSRGISPCQTSPPCLDVSIFPVHEQLGAVLFLSLYGIQACPLTNSSSEGDTTDSSACVDVSWLTAEQKAIVTDIIQPALPCNETSGPTIASPTTWNTTVVCAYISNANNTDRDIAISFITSRGLSLCNSSPPCLDISIFPIDEQPGAVLFFSEGDTTDSSCVDVSWLTAEQKAVVTDIIQPATPCNETFEPTIASPTSWNTTVYCAYISNANDTNRDKAISFITSRGLSPCNSSPPCFDVGIFPVHEQPGAVLFLSLYGINACPLTNSSHSANGTSSVGCIGTSGFTEEQKLVITEVIKPLLRCFDSLEATVASDLVQNSTVACVNISAINDSKKEVAVDFMVAHGFSPCDLTYYPMPATTKSICVDISIYTTPEDRAKAIEFFELYNIAICPENTPTSAVSTEPAVTTPSPCIDVGIFPVHEQPGAVVFLSLYGIQACPLINSSSTINGNNSMKCIDILGFTEEQKALITEVIKPSLPCSISLEATAASPFIQNITLLCVNVSAVNESKKEITVEFMTSHGFSPCEGISNPIPATTESSCVDITIYATPEDRAKAKEFFELYNISICPENTPTGAVSTELPHTTPPPCIDVSIFPVHEQPGAVIFLSLYGIEACPLSNLSYGANRTNSMGCIETSSFTLEQKAVIVMVIDSSLLCNDRLPSTTRSLINSNFTAPCVNTSSLNVTEKEVAVIFMISHGILPCDEMISTTPASTNTFCVDISVYTTQEDRANAIRFFELYNIAICPDSTGTSAATTVSSVISPSLTTSLPCIDVSGFPVHEQSGAIVFLSLYGIKACPLTNSSSGAERTNSGGCIDVSGFTVEQKAVIIEIIKPSLPCNETVEITLANNLSENTPEPCVNFTSLNMTEKDAIIEFMVSRGVRPCNYLLSINTTLESDQESCIDISIYTNSEDRAKAVQFFELYNVTICPEEMTTIHPMTASLPCIDVTIFPVIEQPGAIVLLSMYGIRVCPLKNLSSEPTAANSLACVDVSMFSEEQRTIIFAISNPLLLCNGTLNSPVVNSTTNTVTQLCVNMSFTEDFQKPMVNTFMVSHGFTACDEYSGSFIKLSLAASQTACVDISVYTNAEERVKAIAFLELYNIPICSEITNAVTDPLPCIDVSMFPVNEQPGAVVFLSIYGIQACPLTNSSSISYGDCVDISRFTEEQKVIVIEIIKPSVPCSETSESTTVGPYIDATERPCMNISSVDSISQHIAGGFMLSRGLLLCEGSLNITKNGCVDISFYNNSQDRIEALELFELFNITTCLEHTTQSTTNQRFLAATPALCVDVSIFPLEEQPGAVVFLSLYGIQACNLTSVSAADEGTISSDCYDVSGYTVEQKLIIAEIIKPRLPCDEPADLLDTASNLLTRNETEKAFCINMTTLDDPQKQAVTIFMKAHGLPSCETLGLSTLSPISSIASKTTCTDISGYIDPTERARAIAFLTFYNMTICPEVFSSSTIRPQHSTPNVNANLSGENAETTSGCVNVSQYTDPVEKAKSIEFLNHYNISICPESLSTTSMTPIPDSRTTQTQEGARAITTPLPNCMDLSGYSDPSEKASAAAFFQLYNYTICPDSVASVIPLTSMVTVKTTSNPQPSSSASQALGGNAFFFPPDEEPCLDVSVFPENERSNAVVFLSIYGIIACPLTNSTSSERNCIDLSGFTEARKALVVTLIKPAQPCNESTSASPTEAGTNTPDVLAGSSGEMSTTSAPCVNISNYPVQERAAAVDFFNQYGIPPCKDILTTATPTAARNCVDLSEVVPALRQFVLTLNAPLPACDADEDAENTGVAPETRIVNSKVALKASAPLDISSSISTLCLDCISSDGMCYNPDPDSCANFLRCSLEVTDTTSVSWSPSVVACPPRTFWSQDIILCVHPEESLCMRRT
ncbi:hypothetical protein ElyMa_001668300 [Elysia marginata]|uniref:Chitin-binding type-2 domain-containing protein n=1 Tax=Elysia marginata TaxID=1093978 RepID=A0AAV4JTD1_9GAST|nr:hypothetical protein ElyMa_001668300 [Elysia marginata]